MPSLDQLKLSLINELSQFLSQLRFQNGISLNLYLAIENFIFTISRIYQTSYQCEL